jgi:Emfourin
MAGEHAHISLRRTGGLAGVPMEATLDTRELAPAKAQELLGALGSVELDRLGDARDWPAGAADTFRYELKVQREEGTQAASFSDRGLPAELAVLVRTLMDRAQPARRREE